MKLIVYLIIICAYCSVNAQNVSKKCKTCGKVLSSCSFHGQHPVSASNRPVNKVRPNSSHKPEPYVERTETKGANEDYDLKGDFGSSGLALVKLRGKYGFINKDGEEIVPLKYDSIYCDGYFSNIIAGWPDYEYLMSVSQNNKWGYVNKKGELVVPIIYNQVESYVSKKEISIRCKKGDKWGAVGQDGTIHVPFIYDELIPFYNGHPVYALKDGKYGYIDEYNNTIAPFKYSATNGFSYYGSLAQVCENGKYGFIDLRGQEVIPLEYDFASSFDFLDNGRIEDAIAGIVINKKLGFINGEGEIIIPCQYDYEIIYENYYGAIKPYNHRTIAGGFWSGSNTGLVKKNGKWGVIDRKGNILVPFSYDDYRSRSGSGAIDLVKEGKTFYIDKGGNVYNTKDERNDSSTIRLARQGFPDEQAWIGEYYYRGNHGFIKDYEKALYWFQDAAKQANGKALYYLGWMYEHGQGVDKNLTIAMDYYKKCIKVSTNYHSDSLLRLGHIYYYGKGVEENYYDAYNYFLEAADLGDSEAMFYVGWMYEHGQGVEKKDIEKAKEYYTRSADKGYEKAKKKVLELN